VSHAESGARTGAARDLAVNGTPIEGIPVRIDGAVDHALGGETGRPLHALRSTWT